MLDDLNLMKVYIFLDVGVYDCKHRSVFACMCSKYELPWKYYYITWISVPPILISKYDVIMAITPIINAEEIQNVGELMDLHSPHLRVRLTLFHTPHILFFAPVFHYLLVLRNDF